MISIVPTGSNLVIPCVIISISWAKDRELIEIILEMKILLRIISYKYLKEFFTSYELK